VIRNGNFGEIMKQSLIKILLLTIFCCANLAAAFPAQAQLTLAANGKSVFTIIVPADAPKSVQDAASELQKDIELATGAKLPLQKEDAPVSTPVLSIGSTRQAKAAGISSETMKAESFRIVTKNGNLYILGPDTPDGGWTKDGGVSNGTANGVYTFLEDYLDVRWLMPGDLGRDIPAKSTFTLANFDKTEASEFKWREVTQIWNYAEGSQWENITQWTKLQKLGGSVALNFNHYWWQTINGDAFNESHNSPAVKALYEAHPEWFAMDASGERPFPRDSTAKLETTNQELVKWYAEKAIAALKANKRPTTYSLSPTDGYGWSQSPESKALYDPVPSELYDVAAELGKPSMSSLVRKWYHDIAEIVEKEYPPGRLAGFLYGDYVFPPVKFTDKIPDNFIPVICGIGTYGYSLYRADNQQRYKDVMDSYASVSNEKYYYDLPNQVMLQLPAEISDASFFEGRTGGNFWGGTGIITPTAPDILDRIYGALHHGKFQGAMIYGSPSWSNTALKNYVIAKMQWDPTLNAQELEREWLHRAYGPKAGAVMDEFYQKLNDSWREYYQQDMSQNLIVQGRISYFLTQGMLKDIYAAHYPEMEKLIVKASQQEMTPAQQQRLQLIVDNFIVLQWRLRNAGFLPENMASPLKRNDTQINAIVTRVHPDFPLFPGVITFNSGVRWSPPDAIPWTVQLAPQGEAAPTEAVSPGLGDSRFLIYAAQDGEIRITTKAVNHGAYFASYEIKDSDGKLISTGIFDTATPIVFQGKAGNAYSLFIPTRKTTRYRLQVQGAAVAKGNLQDKTLTLFGKTAPISVYYVPQGTPVDIFQDGDNVIIEKPYRDRAALAKTVMGENFSNARLLNSFDDGWRFSPDPKNDALQRGVTKADFDDSDWKNISPFDWWQMQGYADYHGVAWYRTKFNGAPLQEGERALLYFGAVDGNAVVYLNGEKIAEHTLGENYQGWDQPFTVDVTSKIKSGANVLAVKVTSKSDNTSSGIFKGVALAAGILH
jgi:hypothetical protein